MVQIKKLFLLVVSLAALSACSDAEDTEASSGGSEGAAVLQALERQGVMTVHGPLEVPGGLNAFAASAGTQPLAVYIMPDEDYALVGTLLDSRGNAVAQEELEKLVSAPMGQETWQALEAAQWVPDGDPDADRIVYTFTDANCPFCNELWHSARPWIEGGKVQLRHLMVGVIRADSGAKAAAILEAEDPEAALAYNIQNRESGGIDPLDAVPPEASATLDSNVELMRELGFGGTPGTVVRADDGTLVRHSGAPRGSTLEELFGPL